MRTRRLGDSDLAVSVIGLGCNNFSRPGTATADLAGTTAVIDAALDAGITFLDTADMYGGEPTGSETLIGQALSGRRDNVVLATKFGHQNYPIPGADDWGPKGARSYIRNSVEGSLRRLQTDRIDLLQLHTPDPQTPIGDTLAALTEIVAEGKVRYVGCSNFTADQLYDAAQASAENGWAHFISVQNEYSLLHRDPEANVLEAVRETGAGFIPYFPLFNGLLTGKYTRAGAGDGRLRTRKTEVLEAADWDQLDRFRELADTEGTSMGDLAIAWLLSRPEVASVIAGATTAEQVVQNAGAGEVTVSEQTLTALDEIFPA